ncbi:hypothetical protein [Micromonospora sp. NPDC000442]|uniref:hypothetical protein n=1 Tax=Micromonospora sp. NPDC000442 TaxID=3364217 RepID=UPI0036B9CC6E
MTAKRTRPTSPKPCRCSTFEVGEAFETTGCDRQTARLFAQGHDAKLVSFLVRAELDGKDIHWGRETGVLYSGDAVTAAQSVSLALAAKAGAMLAKAQERAAKKAAKTKKVEPEIDARELRDLDELEVDDLDSDPGVVDAPVPATGAHGQTIKVGRWTYPGTVMPDGVAIYHDKKGHRRVARKGEFRVVA